jgi:hypothetical protein
MRYVLLSVAGVLAAVLLHVAFVNVRDVRRKERFAYNGRRLVRVERLLEKERPSTSAGALEMLARTLGSEGLKDAWGRPFEITVRVDASGIRHYLVRSLGADGIEGPCFAAAGSTSYDPDCDWVTLDGRFVTQHPGV